jgi:hypothetical protein
MSYESLLALRSEGFAGKGSRFQRHNPDKTIATPDRFLGFGGTANLTSVSDNQLTLQFDNWDAVTKTVNFSGNVVNIARVTVAEAITVLTGAAFYPGLVWSADARNGRLRGTYTPAAVPATKSSFDVLFTIPSTATGDTTIATGNYTIVVGTETYTANVPTAETVPPGGSFSLTFDSATSGVLPASNMKLVGDPITAATDVKDSTNAAPTWQGATGTVTSSTPGKDTFTPTPPMYVQFTGELAAALDFGQGIAFGGNGLEIIGFLDDNVVSDALTNDVQDQQVITQEGYMGSLNSMIIPQKVTGATLAMQVRVLDFEFIQLITGGKIERRTHPATGETYPAYIPPNAQSSSSPTFMMEKFVGQYTVKSNQRDSEDAIKMTRLPNCTGSAAGETQGTLAWQLYDYTITATDYTDEFNITRSGQEESILSTTIYATMAVENIGKVKQPQVSVVP